MTPTETVTTTYSLKDMTANEVLVLRAALDIVRTKDMVEDLKPEGITHDMITDTLQDIYDGVVLLEDMI